MHVMSENYDAFGTKMLANGIVTIINVFETATTANIMTLDG